MTKKGEGGIDRRRSKRDNDDKKRSILDGLTDVSFPPLRVTHGTYYFNIIRLLNIIYPSSSAMVLARRHEGHEGNG